MIPISDDNPTLRTPVMTLTLLAVTWAVWIVGQGALEGVLYSTGRDGFSLAASVCNWGLVPGELTHRAPLNFSIPIGPGMACVVDNDAKNWLTPITSIFLHGSWGHILGNSLYLWVFGNNIEDSMGRWKISGVLSGHGSCRGAHAHRHRPKLTCSNRGCIRSNFGRHGRLFVSVSTRQRADVLSPDIPFPIAGLVNSHFVVRHADTYRFAAIDDAGSEDFGRRSCVGTCGRICSRFSADSKFPRSALVAASYNARRCKSRLAVNDR